MVVGDVALKREEEEEGLVGSDQSRQRQRRRLGHGHGGTIPDGAKAGGAGSWAWPSVVVAQDAGG